MNVYQEMKESALAIAEEIYAQVESECSPDESEEFYTLADYGDFCEFAWSFYGIDVQSRITEMVDGSEWCIYYHKQRRLFCWLLLDATLSEEGEIVGRFDDYGLEGASLDEQIALYAYIMVEREVISALDDLVVGKG